MKRLLFSLTWIVCTLSISANADMHVEDFEYPQPAADSWTTPDGIFTHSISPADPVSTTAAWEISDLSYLQNPPTGQALALWPASDQITFNLESGQYVDFVSLDYVWLGGYTQITIVGTSDSHTWEPTGDLSIWKTIDTTGLELGEIQQVYLVSYEGAFDNITINVLPEPTTLTLLAFGAFVLRRRK